MPKLVAGESNAGKYSSWTPPLRSNDPDTAKSRPLCRRLPYDAFARCVSSVPASSCSVAPSSDWPVRVITLTTPKTALVPYSDEAGPRMTSTRSIVATSSPNSLPIDAWS